MLKKGNHHEYGEQGWISKIPRVNARWIPNIQEGYARWIQIIQRGYAKENLKHRERTCEGNNKPS